MADAVLLGDRLGAIEEGLRWAGRARTVVRQNLCWAVLYNVSVLPLAAIGAVAPWLAAIGMSTSSLLVVANALRLSRPARAARGGREAATASTIEDVWSES